MANHNVLSEHLADSSGNFSIIGSRAKDSYPISPELKKRIVSLAGPSSLSSIADSVFSAASRRIYNGETEADLQTRQAALASRRGADVIA